MKKKTPEDFDERCLQIKGMSWPEVPTSCVINKSFQGSNAHIYKMAVLRIGLEEAGIAGNVAVLLKRADGSQAATYHKGTAAVSKCSIWIDLFY